MNQDQLEFAISQYIDGTLPPLERAALEQRLASDPAAAALLEEHRRLDAALKSHLPLPEMDWNSLQNDIRQALAGEQAPIRGYKIGFVRWVAAAAMIAVVSALAAVIYLRSGDSSPPTIAGQNQNDSGPSGVLLVQGPTIARPSGEACTTQPLAPSVITGEPGSA